MRGHSRIQGNEESDNLARAGAEKQIHDELDLSVPDKFNIQGAKLKTISQALMYKGIMEKKDRPTRELSSKNVRETVRVIGKVNRTQETEGTVWLDLKNSAIRHRVQQFLFKMMHNV